MSRLISQSRFEDEQGVIELYDEVPRVLHALLRCLSLTRDFVLCIAQSYSRNFRSRGNLVSSQIPDTIITSLSDAINLIVLDHYKKMDQYKFQSEYAPLLKEFISLQH